MSGEHSQQPMDMENDFGQGPSQPTQQHQQYGQFQDLNSQMIQNVIQAQVQQAIQQYLSNLTPPTSGSGLTPQSGPDGSDRSPPTTQDVPPTAPPSAQTIVNRKRRKMPQWDGKTKNFNVYMQELEDVIRIDRDLMGGDEGIWIDINASLPWEVKRKVSTFYASGKKKNWNWQEFIAHLRRNFGNKEEKSDMQKLLSKLKQKEKQRFCEFFPTFDEALMGAGGESWTEDSKVVWLERSLSDTLTAQLTQTKLDMTDYYNAVRQIEDVAYKFEHTHLFGGNKSGPSTGSSHSYSNTSVETDADGDVIMNRAATSTRGRGGHRSQYNISIPRPRNVAQDGNRRRAKWVTETEISRRREEGLCLRCGSSGHYIADCPYLPPRSPQTSCPSHTNIRHTTIQEMPPQLEEYDEEPTEVAPGNDNNMGKA